MPTYLIISSNAHMLIRVIITSRVRGRAAPVAHTSPPPPPPPPPKCTSTSSVDVDNIIEESPEENV